MTALNESETHLLHWLSQEETNQYGECYGSTLDRLIALKLAYLHSEESEYLNTFIAKRRSVKPDIMYRAVSLTEEGYALAAKLRNK